MLAAWTISVLWYRRPPFEMQPRIRHPPVLYCRGTKPTQAAKSRPLSKESLPPETGLGEEVWVVPAYACKDVGLLQLGMVQDIHASCDPQDWGADCVQREWQTRREAYAREAAEGVADRPSVQSINTNGCYRSLPRDQLSCSGRKMVALNAKLETL